MRNLLVASTALAIGALGLYFATRAPSDANTASTAAAPAVPVERPAVPERPLFQHLEAPVAAAKPAPKATVLRRKRHAAAVVDPSLPKSAFADGRPSRPETETAAYRPENAAVSPAKIARRERNLSNPMDGRWVSGLSGGGARLGVARKATDLSSCASTRNCERKPAPEQAWVAGVVVTAERLEATPTDPLDGQLARGSYLDETPGVYVK